MQVSSLQWRGGVVNISLLLYSHMTLSKRIGMIYVFIADSKVGENCFNNNNNNNNNNNKGKMTPLQARCGPEGG